MRDGAFMFIPADQPPAAAPLAGDDDQRQLAHFLATHNAECPLCGYNLRALTSPRCPECGRELRLTVGLAAPYLRAWIVLAAATCAAGGTGLFFMLMIAVAGWPRVWGSAVKTFFMNASLIYFMCGVPAAAAVLLARRRLMRLPTGRQWLLAWAAVAATSLAMLIFAGLIN